MKNLIVLVLFLASPYFIAAQKYDINYTQLSNPLRYECTITPHTGNLAFDSLDLVTWIFPDGQFMQQSIGIDNSGAVMQSSRFNWQPYRNSTSGPDSIIAYVAKKGKPGNPAISVTPLNTPAINPQGALATFAMASTSTWQIDQSWEYCPGKETLLIASYKIPPACTTGNSITLTYNVNQIDTVKPERYAFQNEDIIEQKPGETKILNLKNNDTINHVYIKFRMSNAIPVDSFFNIQFSAFICGTETDSNLLYRAKGTPHDPNEKLVNHRIVCANNSNRTDLQYFIKFQNDGDGFVDSVWVEDQLPYQLERETFALGDIPDFHRVYGDFNWVKPNGFFILFKNLHLPGINQTNPHYAYNQTTYGFDFTICSQPTLLLNDGFENSADIYFYDHQNLKLPVVHTSKAKVAVELVPTCYNAAISCILPTTEQTGIINSLSVSPNPFSEEILISLDLEEKTRLQAIIRDLNGRLVDQLTNSEYTSGAHEMRWNAAQIPTGVYLLDVQTEHGRITRKIIKM